MTRVRRYFHYIGADSTRRKLNIQSPCVAKFYAGDNTLSGEQWNKVLAARIKAAEDTFRRTTDTFAARSFDLTEKACDEVQDILGAMKSHLQSMKEGARLGNSIDRGLLLGDKFFEWVELAQEVFARGRLVCFRRVAAMP